jgi:fructose-1-phosphate kinase PfkB-like protein
VILAAGLTPAWQQVLVFRRFHYGRINRADEVYRCASGKVCNAGIAIHRLGGPSQTLAPVGGAAAPAMRRDFEAMGVPCRWIATRSDTRICTTILDRASGAMTELVENGSPLDAGELEAFRLAFAEEVQRARVAIVIGSLPQRTPPAYYRELVASARCPVVLDFRGPGLMSCSWSSRTGMNWRKRWEGR